MPKFRVLSRVDAFVDYVAEVEAEDAQAAADIAYEGVQKVIWKKRDVIEFDARRVVTLDSGNEEMEATARGDF